MYISLCQVSGHEKTEHVYIYIINNTILGGGIGDSYCGTFVDNRKYDPIILIGKKDKGRVHTSRE